MKFEGHLPCKGQTPHNGKKFQTFFSPFFSFAIEYYIYETDFTLQKYHFKSSYNWFKIDIHQQLRPLTANYLAMFKGTSTTIYT